MMTGRKWDRTLIVRRIRELHYEGADLSHNAMACKNQALVSAANYHCGSYRRAVEMAGFNYERIRRKPWWTEAWVVRLIRQAHRAGEDLSWRTVSARRDPLGRAASAAVRSRLFGSWAAALDAAGLKRDAVSRYRHWTRQAVTSELSSRRRAGKAVNSGAIQAELPGLYGAAVRYYGSFEGALARAGIRPETVRQRRVWTRRELFEQMRKFERAHGSLSSTQLRRHDPGLERAMVGVFRTMKGARQAAERAAAAARRRRGRP